MEITTEQVSCLNAYYGQQFDEAFQKYPRIAKSAITLNPRPGFEEGELALDLDLDGCYVLPYDIDAAPRIQYLRTPRAVLPMFKYEMGYTVPHNLPWTGDLEAAYKLIDKHVRNTVCTIETLFSGPADYWFGITKPHRELFAYVFESGVHLMVRVEYHFTGLAVLK